MARQPAPSSLKANDNKPDEPKPPSLAKLNIFQRLNKVQCQVGYIQREKKEKMRYSIVTHDAVTALVRPHMVTYGIIYFPIMITRTHNGNRCEMDMVVRFQNIDNPADFMDVASGGYGVDDSDKGPGKAMSYGIKYALLKALGLESGDDPDLDQETQHKTDEANEVEKTTRLAIEDATDPKQLEPVLKQLNKDWALEKLTNAQFQLLRGMLKKKVLVLKGISDETADETTPAE